MNWSALDYTDLANAFLALLTSAIVFSAVKLGRKAKEPQAELGAVEMNGIAIVSSEPLKALTAAIEGATLEAMTARKASELQRSEIAREAEKARQIAHEAVRIMERFRDEIGELRDEVRRLGDVVARRR